MKPIRTLTASMILTDIILFGGFIYANEADLPRVLNAFYWFYCLTAGLSSVIVLAYFANIIKPRSQYSKAKYGYEVVSNLFLGGMLAFYGHFWLATLLACLGVFYTQMHAATHKEG